MASLLTFLEGKKTYLLVLLGALYWVLIRLGYVTDDSRVWELLGVSAAGTIRAAIAKQNNQ